MKIIIESVYRGSNQNNSLVLFRNYIEKEACLRHSISKQEEQYIINRIIYNQN